MRIVARRSALLVAVLSLTAACSSGSAEKQAAPPPSSNIVQGEPQNAVACVTLLIDEICPVEEVAEADKEITTLTVVQNPAIVDLTFPPDYKSAPISAVTTGVATETKILADTGRVLSSSPVASMYEAAGSGNTAGASGGCVQSTSQPNFYAGAPITAAKDTHTVFARYQYQLYTRTFARVINGQQHFQVDVCVKGGADGNNGWRTLYNASVVATNSYDGSRSINLQSDGDNDDGVAAATVNFAVDVGPVSVSASVPTGGDGTNRAFYGRAKYPTGSDEFVNTQTVAQWTAKCTFSRTCGSPNMQANIQHNLFEFPHGYRNARFFLSNQWNYYCAGPFGQGCG